MSEDAESDGFVKYKPDDTDNASDDDALSVMEEKLQTCQDERNQDRYIFFLLLLILVDAHLFTYMPSWGGPIALLVLEIFALVMLARRLDIKTIEEILDRLLNGFGRRP